jgi:hypothetical protein
MAVDAAQAARLSAAYGTAVGRYDLNALGGGSAGGSQSGSMSQTIPVLMNTPQTDWSLQLSQLLNMVGENQYNWAHDQIQRGAGITDENIGRYLDMSQAGTGLADNLISQYRDKFMPMMDSFARQAQTYGSEGRRRFDMGQAESTVAQASKAAQDAAERKLQGFGVNPNSGRYQDLMLTSRVQDAAARAGAGTQAGLNSANTGRQMQLQALQMGQNIPGMAVNALQSGYTGVTGAQNALLGQLGAGASLSQSAAPFFNAASGAIRVPPVGNYQFSQSSSASQQAASGGGGGGGGARRSGGGGDDQAKQDANDIAAFRARQEADAAAYNAETNRYRARTEAGANQDKLQFEKDKYSYGIGSGGVPRDYLGGGYGDGGGSGSYYGGGYGGDGSTIGATSSDSYYGGGNGGEYAQGGPVPRGPTTGGRVPYESSPSMGAQTDDVPAQLNAGEYVIPRDVVQWKGQDFFRKLIEQSRMARTGMKGAPPKPKMKPTLRMSPTFVSQNIG